MFHSLFSTISQLISIYSLLCLIRILLSWIPQAAYSSFGQIISSLCDPYLNWFRRFRFTQIGIVDFSPILALGVLSIASELCRSILITGQFSPWIIFTGIVQLVWSFFSFICNLLIIFLVLRLLNNLFGIARNSRFWDTLDRFLDPVIYKVMSFIPVRRLMRYRTQLIITIVVLLLARVLFGMLVGSLLVRFYRIQII